MHDVCVRLVRKVGGQVVEEVDNPEAILDGLDQLADGVVRVGDEIGLQKGVLVTAQIQETYRPISMHA